ncbi:OmpH family outer membrane protein [Flavihumibacter profundi]|uniref:OmpH family outer membrane protein n=1 Tax=Flavihumibacter profundi TaxID=2716883 RepID=UPI001CC3F086|nr:OmpH family outer membrane protein [Flavihumibacter profundi]MBZ5855567.1 OmpH family outer membrane protein [Flavihumibacter profundi]
MKQLSLVLSVIATLLSGFLLVKQYSNTPKTETPAVIKTGSAAPSGQEFRMAYFDIDSLQNKYQFFKDALAQLKVKEEAMNNELSSLERSYQKKISEWQQKGSTMSQSEADAVQREYAQMQQNYQQRRLTLEQQLETLKMDYKKNIKNKIEVYLKDFNKDNKYAYIMSYEPELMFYKDTAYNITNQLIEGLNAAYQKKEK